MMTTATQKFTRAIRIERSSDGKYGVMGRAMPFADAISYQNFSFDWEVVEALAGWGSWSHAIRVNYGDQIAHYFVR